MLVVAFQLYTLILIPQSLDNYFDEIKKGLENLKLDNLPEIICEPGRALLLKVAQQL